MRSRFARRGVDHPQVARAAALGAGVLSTPWWKTLLRPFLRGAVPLLSLAHAGAWSRDATPKLAESCRGLRLRVVDGARRDVVVRLVEWVEAGSVAELSKRVDRPPRLRTARRRLHD